MDASGSRQTPNIETGSNARRGWTDFGESNFSTEVRFLDLEHLTVFLLLSRPQRDVSIETYREPDTLTSSPPPKLSCGFCFWRAFCCFLSLETTSAGESPPSWTAVSPRPTAAGSSAGRVLDDCDGLDCLRLKMTGALSDMASFEDAEVKMISVCWSATITSTLPHISSQRRLIRRRRRNFTDYNVSNTRSVGPEPRGGDASHPRSRRTLSLRRIGTLHTLRGL